MSVSYGQNSMDWLTNMVWRDGSGQTLRSFKYGMNAVGMITNIATETGETLRYEYDGLDRLVVEERRDTSDQVTYSATYSYDLAGNRTRTAIDDVTNDYSLVQGNRLATFGAEGSVGYDAAGCVTSLAFCATQRLDLTWNGRYELTATATNGAACEAFGYDALGRRAWTWDGMATNWHVYDGASVVADVDTTGGLVRTYVWGPGVDNLLAMTVHTGATAVTYYAVKDHLGSVQALTDENGNIVESYRFDVWGNVLGVFDGSGDPIVRSAIGNRYLWQGREYSWNTGLYYFRARWYDPVTGRFLSNDPIGISGGLNQYVAFNNNPVNYRDPDGTVAWVVPAIILLWAGTEWAVAPDNDCPQDQYKADGIMNMFKTAGIMAGTQGLFSGAKWAWGRLFSKTAPTTALSPYRVTTPGETFIRYESGNPSYTRITSTGGVKPDTFAAPASDGIVPVAERVTTYNLPSPEILRPNTITLTPPPGTPIIGPRPVAGGTGNEVNFWMGY